MERPQPPANAQKSAPAKTTAASGKPAATAPTKTAAPPRSAKKQNPARAQRLLRMGWAASLAGEHVAAVAALEEAVMLSPNDVKALNALALALAKALRPNEAIPYLQKSLLLKPDDIEIHCVLAEISLERGDYATALSSLKQCIALDPKATHPSGIRARALVKKGEKRLAGMVTK